MVAYRIGAAGRLTYINQQPTRGSTTAHLAIDASGRWLLAANYLAGPVGVRPPAAVAALPIEADGGLGPVACGVTHEGAGEMPGRQDGPHPHCVLPRADGLVAVADLGLDRVFVYALDAATGTLTRTAEAAMPARCGPRHLAWASDGLLLASGELDNTVMALAWNGGAPRLVAAASTLPAGWRQPSYAAEIRVSADGRFAYASNRRHDSIAAFALDPGGTLAPLGHVATAAWPRNFCLAPAENFVLVACQHGDEVQVFRRDPASGLLGPAVAGVKVATPMGVAVVRLP